MRLLLLWANIVFVIKWPFRQFARLWLRDSVVHKLTKPVPSENGQPFGLIDTPIGKKCNHGFSQLNVAKYQGNAKCDYCGVKLKDAANGA